MTTPVSPIPKMSWPWLFPKILWSCLILFIAAAVLYVVGLKKEYDQKREDDWRQKISTISYRLGLDQPENPDGTFTLPGGVSLQDLEKFSAVLVAFDTEYGLMSDELRKELSLPTREKFIEMRMVIKGVSQSLREIEFVGYFPTELLPIVDSKKRDLEAATLFRKPMSERGTNYLAAYHANQLGYALLELYNFTSEPDNWQEVGQLMDRINFELSQVGNKVVAQTVYTQGPANLEEAHFLRDSAYRRILFQTLWSLLNKKWLYPESSRRVDQIKELLVVAKLKVEDIGSSDEELERLRLRNPQLPKVVPIEKKPATQPKEKVNDLSPSSMDPCFTPRSDACQRTMHPEKSRTQPQRKSNGRIQGLGKIDTGAAAVHVLDENSSSYRTLFNSPSTEDLEMIFGNGKSFNKDESTP